MEFKSVVMMLIRKITQRIVSLAKHQLLECRSENRCLSAKWRKQFGYRWIAMEWMRCARVDFFPRVRVIWSG